MKPKTLLILLVILGLLAGAGAVLIRSRNANAPSEGMGAYLFEPLPVNDIASIVIQTPGEKVSLRREADSWIVKERFNYRADFSRISDLVRSLKEVKTGRRFDASEAVMKRLCLKSPEDAAAKQEEKGTLIEMADGKGTLLAKMVIGNTRTRDSQKGPPDGQYVILDGGSHVYLIDKVLSAYQSGPATWLEKSPVQVNAAEIRKITCLGPDGTNVIYTVERSEKGKDLALAGVPADRKVKTSSLNRLASALSSLKIEDVEPVSAESKSLDDVSVRLDYTLFDGRVYHVYPGKSCSPTVPCRIRLEVALETPRSQAPRTVAESETGAGASVEEEKAPTSKAVEEAAAENSRLTPWVFTIPEWQHQALFTDPESLLEPKVEKRDAPGAPAK